MVAAIHETAYPRINSNLSVRDIKSIYTPSKKEWIWVKRQRIDREAWLGYIVLLKTVKRLGYFPAISSIPLPIISYVGQCVSINPPATHKLFSSNKAYQRAQEHIRKYLRLKKLDQKSALEWLQPFADDVAQTKESTVDIINALIEVLVKDSYELPALSFLERVAGTSKSEANENNYNKVTASLSKEAIEKLLSLLEKKNDDNQYFWTQLKAEPRKPTSKTIAIFIKHSEWVKSLYEITGSLPEIPESKRQQYVMEAKAYDVGRMKELKSNKRIALIALSVNEQFYFTTDCIIDMFIKEVRKLHNRAKSDLKKFQLNATKESEELIKILREVASLISEIEEGDLIEKITHVFEGTPEKVVNRCDLLVNGLNDHLQFLGRRYTTPVRPPVSGYLSPLKF